MRLTGSFQTTVTHGASRAVSWPVIGCSTSTGATPTCRHLPSSQVSHSPDVSVPLPPGANAWTFARNPGCSGMTNWPPSAPAGTRQFGVLNPGFERFAANETAECRPRASTTGAGLRHAPPAGRLLESDAAADVGPGDRRLPS